jgi:hypothetical protein
LEGKDLGLIWDKSRIFPEEVEENHKIKTIG